MEKLKINKIVKKRREFFNSGATKSVETRILYLKKIKNFIINNENRIAAALNADLGKSPYGSYLCEIAIVVSEVNYMLKNIRKLTKNKNVHTPFGGGYINETDIHVIITAMGFGGVGESGMGQYHGKDGFNTFTHYASIVDKKNWIDLGQRYQPYNKLNIWFSRNLNFGSTIHKALNTDYKLLPDSFNDFISFCFRKK